MKKKTSIFTVFLTILVLFSVGYHLYLEAKHQALISVKKNFPIRLEIKLEEIEMLFNHSVGHSWETGIIVNEDFILRQGESIILNAYADDKMTVKVAAVEHDSIPDVGQVDLEFQVSKINLARNNLIEEYVYVRENRGRYTGNYAWFRFLISIKRIVSIKEIIDKIL